MIVYRRKNTILRKGSDFMKFKKIFLSILICLIIIFFSQITLNADDNIYYSNSINPINLNIQDGTSGGGVVVATLQISFSGDKATIKFVPKNGYSQGSFSGNIYSVTYNGTYYDQQSYFLAKSMSIYKPSRGHITISGKYIVGSIICDVGKTYVYG